MPPTKVFYYRDHDGRVPVLEWLVTLGRHDRRASVRCERAVQDLARKGHELRRPHADHLRDGIYELRVRCGRVHYRLLYFFHGRHVAVVAAALTKESRVPDVEIRRALDCRKAFSRNPGAHAHAGEY